MSNNHKYVLTIAGSDTSGGAGIQSDLKTFHAHKVNGFSVVTAVTSQNLKGVQSSYEIPPDVVKSQIDTLFDSYKINIVKTGMLSSDKIVKVIYNFLKNRKNLKLIIDPVIYSTSGFPLLNSKGVKLLKSKLLSLAYLVTPNLKEAEILSGIKIKTIYDLENAAKNILKMGSQNVLIKGGHFKNNFNLKPGTDVLYNGKKFYLFTSEFIKTKKTHGTGCILSAAIVSNLATGYKLIDSISYAKEYLIKSLMK